MAAPKGNKFWLRRSKHGVCAIFSDPDVLWASACEYFDYIESNRWVKKETKTKPHGKETSKTETEAPFLLSGLCIFLGVNTRYFNNFKTSKTFTENDDFNEVYTRIEDVIRTQKMTGAIVGAFNPAIIASDLGLKNHVETSGNANSGITIVTSEPETVKKLSDKLHSEGNKDV